MLHDFEIMFDDLFSESGLSLDRCRAFLAIVEAGGGHGGRHSADGRHSTVGIVWSRIDPHHGSKKRSDDVVLGLESHHGEAPSLF